MNGKPITCEYGACVLLIRPRRVLYRVHYIIIADLLKWNQPENFDF